jgi:hypothetical protein
MIEKTGSQVFLPLYNSTDTALYCKNDLVSSQNALSTEDLIFIWFLANAAKKFHIVGEKTFYCAKTLYHDNFPINFEHLKGQFTKFIRFYVNFPVAATAAAVDNSCM